MTKKINFKRIIAIFFLVIFFPSLLPVNLLYASNNGPSAPEASGFESINATDMVNLATGDMSYVLPLMDVGGLPITMAYHGGIPLDMESTWTGLGWNLNMGAINRGLNATPDDWKGGNSMDFIYYSQQETTYNLDVGVGINSAAEVGIGASWGSNKSLSGSVFASVGLGKDSNFGASTSIDTNGNYSLGVNAGVGVNGKNGKSGFGGGLGISGNVNQGGIGFNIGAGVRSNGLIMGVGASITGEGTSYSASAGYTNRTSWNSGQSGSLSLSTGNFSSGDWQIESKGWYIPINIHVFSFGFGKRKVTSTLQKAYNKEGFGVLYSNEDSSDPYNDVFEPVGADGVYYDYQNRYRYSDVYDQSLPVGEEVFTGDYDQDREKINFSFAGYDSYDVNASGISGMMTPKIFQNSTIYGLGYQGPDPYDGNRKMRIYNHNTLTTEKTFGKNIASDIEFYFNGQFTQNKTNTSLSINNLNGNSLEHIFNSRPAVDNTRSKQKNYIEVFTNSQIKNNQSNGLLSPLSPTSNGTNLLPLSRNTPEYKNEAIGGYKITAPDGKVYHFSQPVYHFEMVERTLLKERNETYGENNISEKRQYSSYATHWLLTAVTGPDFIDVNNNKIADQEDYGYWVRMDYGKWSDGFVWRNPTDKNLKDYSSNLKESIGNDDYGTYQFGRKQLYYLDRVVSPTQTAYFVKDLRFDSSGCDLAYSFTETLPLRDDGVSNGDNNGLPVFPYENGIYYKKQLQLVLEKIILVDNKETIVSKGNPDDPLKLNTYGLNNFNYVKSYKPGFRGNIFNTVHNNIVFTVGPGGFYNEYGNPDILINNESGVYDVKDFEEFDYNNATKVIDLEYNYNLAVKDHNNNYQNPTPNMSLGSPGAVYNSIKNPNVGKLCLKSIRFLGRNNYDFMPPYKFEYNGEYKGINEDYIKYPANAIVQKAGVNWHGLNVIPVNGETPVADLRAKDEWGFHKDIEGQESRGLASAWTMTKIHTPTGGEISFEHEEDDFHTEAFSRRYWSENLKFRATDLVDKLLIEVEDENGLMDGFGTNTFKDYFQNGDKVFMDLWLCRKDKDLHIGGTSEETGIIDINSNNVCTVYQVTNTGVKLLVNKLPVYTCPVATSAGTIGVECAGTLYGNAKGLALNNFFSKTVTTSGSHFAETDKARGQCVDFNNSGCGIGCPDHWTLSYKLIASKTPKDKTGGGLRVKTITVKDELNNSYKTNYYYNVPGFAKNKADINYKSSGITSYSPVRGQKFVPYQSELPSPGVMYEYVTMEAEDINNTTIGSTVYQFYTLKPVLDIFNPNIVMQDDDGTVIFKANVVQHPINVLKMLFSKSIDIEVNTSLIGQFKSVTEYNNKGQLLTKVEREYMSGIALENSGINSGSVKESFQSMKSIFTTPNDHPDDLTLKKRVLSISSRKDYSSVLLSTTTTNMHGKVKETFSKTDPETGEFLVVEKENAKGLKKKTERIPAYKKYPELGSKVNNPNNRHMLSQEAMVIESVNGKTTSANITTWNKEWKYRDNYGIEESPTLNAYKIWRKHKNFSWKEGLNNDGSLITQLSENNNLFDWTLGTPLSTKWKKTSEITRYNHYSMPVETKDINGNFASSKMADNQNKVIVSGNARYTEMYFSGAEYVASGNVFEGEVKGADFRTTDVAHTGMYSIKSNNDGDELFQVEGSSGSNNYYTNTDANYTATFRPGKYKVSYWVFKNPDLGNCKSPQTINYGTQLLVNGTPVAISEVVSAGCWTQLNFVFDLPENNVSNQIVVKNAVGDCGIGTVYVDDFRMYPLASSITSYVYDAKTNMLSYILNPNNMATAYKYDNAGRLIATYAEDIDKENIAGGFKLINQVKQNYISITPTVSEMNARIDNCLNIENSLSATINNECIGTFNNKFKVNVSGGTGNYSYQYKWLKDAANNIYTNYISGSSTKLIPYVPVYCSGDASSGVFSKRWSFVVKVKDLNTNQEIEQPYSYEGNCEFKKYHLLDNAIEVSNCSASNCPGETTTFRIHLKDIGEENSDLRYEFANLEPFQAVDDPSLVWTDVTNTNGVFCPSVSGVEDPTCPSGTRKMFRVCVRVINVQTGEIIQGTVENIYFGECSEFSLPIINGNSLEEGLSSGGVILLKNSSGDIIESVKSK